MDTKRKLLVAGAALVTVGAGGVGGAAIASAASTDTAASGYGRPGYGPPGARGEGGAGRDCGPGGHDGRGAPGTAVTGAELAKVKAAVKKKDAAVTVQDVHQESDGRYHVRGTKAGTPVMLEVSKDLATVTERTGPPRGPGGPGGHHGRGPAKPSTSPSASPSA